MTAKEMAEQAVGEFLMETGECPGVKLAFNETKNHLAYAYAWENFLNYNDEEVIIPEFCIVEDFVHHFLLYGV